MNGQSSDLLLVLNAGSSSIKFSLYDAVENVVGLQCAGNGTFEVRADTERLIFCHSGHDAQKREESPLIEASTIPLAAPSERSR